MPDIMDSEPARCLGLSDVTHLAGGGRPWSPGRREDEAQMERAAASADKIWCLAEVDIFCDLSAEEMDRFARAAPVREYAKGALIYTPHQPIEALFILKRGRIRIFRLSPDGRALTTAIIEPGTIFGEMVIVGQQMHDNFAEALDDVVTCVMTRPDVQRLLLGDQRVAARISETLGRRLSTLEQRLTDTVFKTVAERIATSLLTLSQGRSARPLGRGVLIKLTHEQIAALAATSRETTTKILGEYAEQGLISLGRGRITVLDQEALRAVSGE